MEANEPKKEQNTEEMDVMKQFIRKKAGCPSRKSCHR